MRSGSRTFFSLCLCPHLTGCDHRYIDGARGRLTAPPSNPHQRSSPNHNLCFPRSPDDSPQVLKYDPEWDERASVGFSRCDSKSASETTKNDFVMIGIVQKGGTWDPVLSYQVGGEVTPLEIAIIGSHKM